MKTINNIRLPLGSTDGEAISEAIKLSGCSKDCKAVVAKKSIDARRSTIWEIYSVNIYEPNETDPEFYDFSALNQKSYGNEKIFVVGFGPAGIFAAYLLTLSGFKPTVVERGEPVEKRAVSVETFLNGGKLNEDSNVQYGEGGAGTFSDGKLTTRINDPRCKFVLKSFAKHGAPEEILYKARPHIGTDVLRKVVADMRYEIIKNGGKILYNTKMTDIEIKNGKICGIYLNGEFHEAENLFIATGNGARDTYEMLLNKEVATEAKPFSVGFRMEFPQEELNAAVYGKNSANRSLPPAEYNFFTHIDGDKTNTVYTFCMCPGGHVINSSSENGYLVTNGMSYHARNGKNANSALLASVKFNTPNEGIEFQKAMEKSAYDVAKGLGPVTLAKDFLDKKSSKKLGRVEPTFRPGVEPANLYKLFPESLSKRLAIGLSEFQKKIFKCDESVLTGVETRTSAPLRILRDSESFEALGISGLYPCGEGSGYAGGIVSSAADGLRAAEALIKKITGIDVKN